MHLLVTGLNGQVAQALSRLAAGDITVTARGRPDLDILEAPTIRAAIEAARPDIVVNAAAYTAVDAAESDEAAAFRANRDGAANAARAAASAGLPIVHLSTDYVFAGDKTEPYVETDTPAPAGVYGRSKLAGEEAVAAANPRHVILRTAWVYSDYGKNFLKTMLRVAGERDELRVVSDQFGTPTFADDIAAGIAAVARRIGGHPETAPWGVYHLVSGGETSWAGFAEAIFAASAMRGGPSARVEPIATADYPTPALRPANSRLDTSRFVATFGWQPPHWSDGTAACVQRLLSGDEC